MIHRWQEIARSLSIGSKRKVACCSSDPSTYISNNERGISLGPCFRCGHSEFEPHGERSIEEILRTRRAADALAANKTPTIPADTVPLTAGPREAWQWVLKGGLMPEQAEREFGFTWHEASRRVLIPVKHGSKLVALVGRSVHGERPKYRAMGGDANTIFRLPERPQRACVVTEDILSAIAVWRSGVNAVAVLGTYISPEQAHVIAKGRDRIIGWFDGDAAGDKAWTRLRSRMSLHPVELIRVRTDKDPKNLHRARIERIIHEHIGA